MVRHLLGRAVISDIVNQKSSKICLPLGSLIKCNSVSLLDVTMFPPTELDITIHKDTKVVSESTLA